MNNLKDTITAVLQRYPLAAAYLFGSRAKDTAHVGSDIDIAVLFEAGKQAEDILIDIVADLAEALELSERQIDVSQLPDLPLPLRFKIFQEGQQLFSRDDEQVRYELLRTAALYHDQQPFIQAADEQFAQSLRS